MNQIYRNLTNEAFEEFRHASYKMRTLQHLSGDLDDGTTCPACSQVVFPNLGFIGTLSFLTGFLVVIVTMFFIFDCILQDPSEPLTIALDGNFGLVRKRSAGKSMEPPKHGDRLFLDDQKVQEIVNGCSDDGKLGEGVS